MIVLFGHGYVGTAIARELRRQMCDFKWLSHKDRFPEADVYINAAGFVGTPNVDDCESRRLETLDGNVGWALRLAERGIPTIHVSSGCLYRGGPWDETDPPNFFGSWYSTVKAFEEKALAPFLKTTSYLLRIRMPFGREEHPRNLLTKLRSYGTLVDGRNSLTSVEDLARVVVWFAFHRPDVGTYNVCNPGEISTAEIADLLPALALGKHWVSQEEFRTLFPAERSFCTLATEKLQRLFPLRDVFTAIRSCA